MSFLFILFDGPTIQDPFCWIYKMNSSVVRPDRKTLKMDGHDSEDTKQSTADMTAFVQNLLQQMQSSSLDDMGGRINELEQSINDLRAEMGVEGTPPAASKSGDEPKTPPSST
ncbi:BnaC01g22260D [Brassica napus]|uniref:BnaC01g22260D protein n=1 Tax=Brassica napus TaxID=3708 RepID=A0A078I2X6_BRANA|nr:BnaC01g22260D [Brassica napus]